jgi:membrane-bound inhibitor of C-type lysozyme
MAIEWHKVTRFSQAVAIVLALVIWGVGFIVGMKYGESQTASTLSAPIQDGPPVINDVTYACDGNKNVRAIYRRGSVELLTSDSRHLVVPQSVSGSGARYANEDESFVFWNKGDTAFVTEGAGDAATTTFANCTQVPGTGNRG